MPFLFGGNLSVSRLTVRVPIRFGGNVTPHVGLTTRRSPVPFLFGGKVESATHRKAR